MPKGRIILIIIKQQISNIVKSASIVQKQSPRGAPLKGVLRNSPKFTGKCQSHFFNKVAGMM